ncbi:MAG: hypothetical protein JJE04_11345 [Acidobacteriia bacterium]|nr:hypothetical protein [Terriglobia bacterium]
MIAAVTLLLMLSAASGTDPVAGPITGTWACQSMNAGAYTGRSCRQEPWLKLHPDKTYDWGRETGSWEYNGGVLSLSGRSGKGRLDTGGKLIYEYVLRGQHYLLTLYRRQ